MFDDVQMANKTTRGEKNGVRNKKDKYNKKNKLVLHTVTVVH